MKIEPQRRRKSYWEHYEEAKSGQWAGLLQAEIAVKFGLRIETVKVIQKDLGIQPTGRSKLYPFDKMNWELPNTDLEEIWSLKFNRAAIERSSKRRGRPRWKRNGLNTPKDVLYYEALEQEKVKQKEYENDISKIQVETT